MKNSRFCVFQFNIIHFLGPENRGCYRECLHSGKCGYSNVIAIINTKMYRDMNVNVSQVLPELVAGFHQWLDFLHGCFFLLFGRHFRSVR